jgi:hypothetical protein
MEGNLDAKQSSVGADMIHGVQLGEYTFITT